MSKLRHVQNIFKVLLILGLLLPVVYGVTVSAQQQPSIIRLGLLSAANSPGGQGAQLAIAEINGAGGITGPDGSVYAIELLSTPAQTAAEVRAGLAALIDRDVIAILGPDDNAVVLETLNDLNALGLPVLTAATHNSITGLSNSVFRIRAPEQTYMQAVADYLASTMGQPTVAIVQGNVPGVAESVAGFTTALQSRNITPISTLQAGDGANLGGTVASLIGLNPAVLAVWADPAVATNMLQGLRGGGWTGVFFYTEANNPDFRVLQTPNTASGVLGVTNWTPGVRSAASDNFLRTYVTTFSSVPDGLSAAYYDAIYLLAAAVGQAGNNPAAIRGAFLLLSGQVGVQGTLSPGQFGNGETTDAAALVGLNVYAAPQVQMLFSGGQLVANEGATGPAPGPDVAGLPSPTPQPNVTATPIPTATPEGVYGLVTSFRLNVRTGPSTNYDVLGQLQIDDTVFPIGANNDFTWMVISFRGTQGWVATYLLDLQGDLNRLPIVIPPASPTPQATATFTPVPFTATPSNADLVITAATMDPATPQSGQAFNVRVTVRNAGTGASNDTALAVSFQPGEVYTSANIPPLVPGQSVELTLTATVNGTGTYTVQVVADLNNMVNEGSAGETNNLFPMTYTVDRALLASGTGALVSGGSVDLVGGTSSNDIAWDGANLTIVGGATIAVLPGLSWNTLHYDQLTGITGTSIPKASMPNGTVVGVLTTPEGYRAAIVVNNYDGNTLNYSYRVYAP